MESYYFTVVDLMNIFHCGRNKAYQICHQPGFPTTRVGKKILINKQRLQEWLDSHENQNQPERN